MVDVCGGFGTPRLALPTTKCHEVTASRAASPHVGIGAGSGQAMSLTTE